MSKVRIGIIGYGNIGRGVEAAIKQNPDCEMAESLQDVIRLQ